MKRLLLCFVLFAVIGLAGCKSGGDDEDKSTKLSTDENTVTTTAKEDNCVLSGVVLNTGKSDCIFMKVEGKNILIDAADDDDSSKIVKFLADNNVTKLDYFIITHLDKDHIGSADKVVRSVQVDHILKPDYDETSAEYEELNQALMAKNMDYEIIENKANKTYEFGETIIRINAPSVIDKKDPNNNSLIVYVKCKNTKLLFMGDAVKTRCEEFNKSFNEEVDFVKTPHHGDTNKYLNNLLNRIKPKYAVVTASNQYDIEVGMLSVLDSIGCNTYKTYDGDVKFYEKDGSLVVTQ